MDPPLNIALVEFETAPDFVRATDKFPKSEQFPVDANSIVSITFVTPGS